MIYLQYSLIVPIEIIGTAFTLYYGIACIVFLFANNLAGSIDITITATIS